MSFILSSITGSIKFGMRVAKTMTFLPFKIGFKVAIFCLTSPFIIGWALGFAEGAVGTFVLADSDRRQKLFAMLGF